jgi:hypothetical protein
LQKKIHPDVVLDDPYEVIDEPNFNNYNTSPDPPSPYADLEKKYRKNKFNRNRKASPNDLYGTSGVGSTVNGLKNSGTKVQKKKGKKTSTPKTSRVANGKRMP